MAMRIEPGLLARLAQAEPAAALAELTEAGLATSATAAALAEAALGQAETDPGAARHWLDAADNLLAETDDETAHAQVLYARARLLVMDGDLPAAEAALRDARDTLAGRR